MFLLLRSILQGIQPLLVPICFVSAWVLVAMALWSIWAAVRDTASRTRRLHQIPCAGCEFFTKDYHLKCTVHPSLALTEDAIDCQDYEPKQACYPVLTHKN